MWRFASVCRPRLSSCLLSRQLLHPTHHPQSPPFMGDLGGCRGFLLSAFPFACGILNFGITERSCTDLTLWRDIMCYLDHACPARRDDNISAAPTVTCMCNDSFEYTPSHHSIKLPASSSNPRDYAGLELCGEAAEIQPWAGKADRSQREFCIRARRSCMHWSQLTLSAWSPVGCTNSLISI